MIELRCSSLPLALTCPGSVRPEGLTLEESGPESALGTCAHEALSDMAESGIVPWGETGALARRHKVDERELRALLSAGAALWREVGAMFPEASTEHALTYRDPAGAFVLTGHLDVVSWPRGLVRVGDWKTGRRDAEYREQLMGYCVLALAAGEGFGATEAEAIVMWVRDGEIERHRMRRAHMPRWLARIRRVVVEWDGRYHAGPHCAHCPRSHECPAGLALIRRDVSAVLGSEALGPDALSSLEPAALVALLERADLAAAVGARVRAAIRAHVERVGDVVGGGKRLTLQHEERRDLDVLRAFPVLEALGFTDPDFAEIMKLSIAGAERIAAQRAGRGKGAAASRALGEALQAAAAITTQTTTKLTLKRA